MKKALLSMLACLMFASALAADTTYQPFVLASVNDAGLEEQTARTRAALETAGFQVAGSPDDELKERVACGACPGIGSCGGMFTYNTMQTFIGVVGLQPLHMVAPASDDPRRVEEFPDQLVTYLWSMIEKDIKPRDIVSRDSIRNAVIVAMAVGGSTNVVLHAPEIARAAGFENFWRDIMSP